MYLVPSSLDSNGFPGQEVLYLVVFGVRGPQWLLSSNKGLPSEYQVMIYETFFHDSMLGFISGTLHSRVTEADPSSRAWYVIFGSPSKDLSKGVGGSTNYKINS